MTAIPFAGVSRLGAPLPVGMVHVWRADLDSVAARPSEHLHDDELERAKKFRDPLHGARFAAGRSALRLLLAAYTQGSPRDFEFDVGPHGKPILRGDADMHFNVSHSAELLLVALNRTGPVGVDCECHREVSDRDQLARRAFSSREFGDLQALPEAERSAAFYRGWTRKEAFLKALGTGIAQGLDTFDVVIGPGAAAPGC